MKCEDCANYKAKEPAEKSCLTCKHFLVKWGQEPCKTCAEPPCGRPKWEPVEAKPQTATAPTTYNGKQYREVKRKAKVGELVKIVDRFISKGKYKDGDVLTCKKVVETIGIYAKEFDYPEILHSEYVVLEPITNDWQCGDCGHWNPASKGWCDCATPKKPIKQDEPPYKVGDRVRIVDLEKLKECRGIAGSMYPYAGRVLTIQSSDRGIFGGVSKQCWHMEEDREWYWSAEMIAGKAKRVYTDAQIAEAKNIVYDALVKHDGISFFIHDKTTGASMDVYDYKAHTKSRLCASTTCSNSDEYNEHIGRMVAICKLLGEKMPKWLQGE